MNRILRPFLYLFALTRLLVSSTLQAIEIGDTAPDWVLKNGSRSETSYYRDSTDKVTVLLYWATWCPYCQKLMPHLQQIADQYQGLPVIFYAMNIKEDGDPVKHLKDNGFSFELILNAEQTMDAYGVRGTPSLFVVDRHHKVTWRRIPDSSDEAVKAAVSQAIAEALKPR
jgi:cytochrome c biogenesis protein CcmG/thiol:disulfide interchange protein DsbE